MRSDEVGRRPEGRTAMIVVVGAGIAGTAAALAAARRGAPVTLVDGGPGATALGSGALDGDATLDDDARAILDELALVDLVPGIALTTSGALRRVVGGDRALLRLSAGASVFVPESSHPRWRGARLATVWADSALAHDASLSFSSTKVSLLSGDAERAMGDVELAALFDDEARIESLGARLRAALPPGTTHVALPPWLGCERARAAALSAIVGVTCGEVLGDPAGPAGERFVHARDAALAKAGVKIVRSTVKSTDGRAVTLDDGSVLRANAVVLAIGGVAGGGIHYSPSAAIASTALPPHPRASFTLSVDAPLALGHHGRPILVPGSMFGIAAEDVALPLGGDVLLDRIGVLPSGAPPALFVAGDVVADRPRHWLEALRSGVAAGAAAHQAAFALGAP